MKDQEKNRESQRQRRLNIIVTIALVLSVLLCVYVVGQVLTNGYVSIGGFMLFRVVTGSMEPTIPVGALMMARQVDILSVRMNDIVCFRTQEAEIYGKIVTHRVVGIETAADGSRLLETKGDANLVMDGYYVSRENFIGKVVWYTGSGNGLASVFSFFTSRIGFLGCIVFPCLLFAGLILRDSVGNIRKELAAYQEAVTRLEAQQDWRSDPLYGLSQQEYDEMVNRIRAELMEELMQYAEVLREELRAKTE